MANGRKASRAIEALNEPNAREAIARVEKQITGVVREHPLLAVGAAMGAGALLGGVLMRNAGRLLFVAAASAVVSEVWKSEGGIDVRGLIDRLSGIDDDGDDRREREGRDAKKSRAGVA